MSVPSEARPLDRLPVPDAAARPLSDSSHLQVRAERRPEDDRHLVARALEGDREAYGVLFNRHAEGMWRTAYLILHNSAEADDAVQEAFTLGLSRIDTYRGESEPRAWFYSIIVNVCRHFKRGKRYTEPAGEHALEEGRRVGRARTRGVLSSMIRRERNTVLAVCLGYLTDRQREAFVLHHVDGLPHEDVAKIMEIRPGAARALVHRAKEVLRERMGNQADSL
jgi:RNA polymerase sigma-70 factor (ECF subfamily)